MLLTLAVLCGCHKHCGTTADSGHGDTLQLKYAKGFCLISHDGYRQLDIYSPWSSERELQQRYYLVARNSDAAVPLDGIRVSVPVKSWATSSCTHIGYLNAINETQNISGVTNPGIIYTQQVLDSIDTGQITDIGDALNINTEILLSLKPDMLILNLIGANDKQAQHITATGITILYNNEWKERTPLARTEWIKAMAAFCGKDSIADSLFNLIESNYLTISDDAQHYYKRPSLMSGGNFRGTWYVPGGQTYMGHLFRDAASAYVFDDDDSPESLPLSMEQALVAFADADVWVGAPARSIDELLKQDSKYGMLSAVKNKSVYNFYRRDKQGGANDFWETGVMRPDLILKDLVKILHPEYMPADTLNFARQLE